MPLPTFIIAGERRCGTTSLYHAMTAHPDVWLHPRRELGYFVEEELREWRGRELDSLPEGEWERTHSADGYAACFDEAGDADLIVVGTHGRTSLTHMLIGSVAEKIVRKAPCPVLSVKHPDHQFEIP